MIKNYDFLPVVFVAIVEPGRWPVVAAVLVAFVDFASPHCPCALLRSLAVLLSLTILIFHARKKLIFGIFKNLIIHLSGQNRILQIDPTRRSGQFQIHNWTIF